MNLALHLSLTRLLSLAEFLKRDFVRQLNDFQRMTTKCTNIFNNTCSATVLLFFGQKGNISKPESIVIPQLFSFSYVKNKANLQEIKFQNSFGCSKSVLVATSIISFLTHSLKISFNLYIRYLSNRPQVSVGYKLINHAGGWQNTRSRLTNQSERIDLVII